MFAGQHSPKVTGLSQVKCRVRLEVQEKHPRARLDSVWCSWHSLVQRCLAARRERIVHGVNRCAEGRVDLRARAISRREFRLAVADVCAAPHARSHEVLKVAADME